MRIMYHNLVVNLLLKRREFGERFNRAMNPTDEEWDAAVAKAIDKLTEEKHITWKQNNEANP